VRDELLPLRGRQSNWNKPVFNPAPFNRFSCDRKSPIHSSAGSFLLTSRASPAPIRCEIFYDGLDQKTGSCSSGIPGNTKELKLAAHSSNFRKQECEPQNSIKLSASKIQF
jgi:hypothetical protein